MCGYEFHLKLNPDLSLSLKICFNKLKFNFPYRQHPPPQIAERLQILDLRKKKVLIKKVKLFNFTYVWMTVLSVFLFRLRIFG